VSWLVLDASTVLTWCFPDEISQKAVEIAEQIAVATAWLCRPSGGMKF
jgi:hypothetical protein